MSLAAPGRRRPRSPLPPVDATLSRVLTFDPFHPTTNLIAAGPEDRSVKPERTRRGQGRRPVTWPAHSKGFGWINDAKD